MTGTEHTDLPKLAGPARPALLELARDRQARSEAVPPRMSARCDRRLSTGLQGGACADQPIHESSHDLRHPGLGSSSRRGSQTGAWGVLDCPRVWVGIYVGVTAGVTVAVLGCRSGVTCTHTSMPWSSTQVRRGCGGANAVYGWC
jgi:hypothetical protein